MKKRWTWLLTVLALFGLLCVPVMAGAEPKEIKTDFVFTVGAGETIQPDYPDFSSLIGEGLTKDDFTISYSRRITDAKVDPVTGQVTIRDGVDYEATLDVYVTYTPVTAGVGKETVFCCTAHYGEALKWIKPEERNLTLALGQSETMGFESNGYEFPGELEIKGFDPNVVQASIKRSMYSTYHTLSITPVGLGETTITIYGYNGVSAKAHVKVMLPPTKLCFAQEVFYGYVGDEIDLGLDYGGSECSPNIHHSVTSSHGRYTFKDGYAIFCPEKPDDYTIRAYTFNGFEAETRVKVYDRESAVRLKANVDQIIEGAYGVTIQAYDANGKELRIRKFEVTKGQEIAQMSGNSLITTGVGQIEVTCYNYDGSTCSQTFDVEVRPTEILLNATEVTLEIGETFDVEVSFDKGYLPYEIDLSNNQDKTEQNLEATRLEGNRIIAQAPGKALYAVLTNYLSATISVTVRDSDKAVSIQGLDEPLHKGQSYQLYVCDKTGKIYPAVFSMANANTTDGKITSSGYLTALEATNNMWVTAQLADGRKLTATHIDVIRYPTWIKHDAIVTRKSQNIEINMESDVGQMRRREATFQVDNEQIIAIEDGVIFPKRIGKTTVTATSVHNPAATTTFTVEVISDTSTIYIGTTSMSVPYGSARPMPIVYDEKGREVKMVWKITHDNPGAGNPEKSGFTIEDGIISCTWPTASCEVTGTVRGGSKKVKVTVKGFRLPETIYMEPEQVWLEPGETQTLKLMTEDEHGSWGVSYWEAEKDGIVTMEPYVDKQSNTIKAVGSGETLVAAVLENGAIAMCIVNVYDPDERLPGDVNEDGAVDGKDALIIMQYSAGWPVLINGWQGDVNADGSTNLQDALLIFQYASGLDVELMQYIPAE